MNLKLKISFQEFSDTKAIVFCEYRESVFLINRMLLANQPLIKPKVFVGMLYDFQGGKHYIFKV